MVTDEGSPTARPGAGGEAPPWERWVWSLSSAIREPCEPQQLAEPSVFVSSAVK